MQEKEREKTALLCYCKSSGLCLPCKSFVQLRHCLFKAAAVETRCCYRLVYDFILSRSNFEMAMPRSLHIALTNSTLFIFRLHS